MGSSSSEPSRTIPPEDSGTGATHTSVSSGSPDGRDQKGPLPHVASFPTSTRQRSSPLSSETATASPSATVTMLPGSSARPPVSPTSVVHCSRGASGSGSTPPGAARRRSRPARPCHASTASIPPSTSATPAATAPTTAARRPGRAARGPSGPSPAEGGSSPSGASSASWSGASGPGTAASRATGRTAPDRAAPDQTGPAATVRGAAAGPVAEPQAGVSSSRSASASADSTSSKVSRSRASRRRSGTPSSLGDLAVAPAPDARRARAAPVTPDDRRVTPS